MILRAVESIESIGGAEDSRWEEKEDREWASVACTAGHPNAERGCPQGTFSVIGARENFSLLSKAHYIRKCEISFQLANSLVYPLSHIDCPLHYRFIPFTLTHHLQYTLC